MSYSGREPDVAEIVDAIDALPRKLRDIIVLHAAGYAITEIEQRTGLSHVTVWRYLKRAQRRLEQLLFCEKK